MKAIFDRELKAFFDSPVGYIFAGVFIALCSFFFVNGALMYQTADLNVVFSNINVVYLFLISMLTMGLFSTERSRKTDQLLLTSPVSISKIVTGKYLAALGVFGTTLVLSLVYPIVLNLFGNPSVSEIIGTYIGFILLWSTFIAIGTFISALTESQIIAAVITFGVLLIVFYMKALTAGISNETIKSIVRWFSLMDKYSEFQAGVLNFESVVYYISFIFVFLFLTAQVIKRGRYSDKKVRVNNLIVTAATVAAVVLVNAIVSTVAAKLPLKIDLTHDKVYEYSEQTKEVLGGLTEDVNIYALYSDTSDGTYVNTVREYLDRYKHLSDKIKVSYKDPYEDPAFVRQFGSDITAGSLIVQQGDRSRVIPYNSIYSQSQYTGSVSIDAERLITSAVRYVSGTGSIVHAYFTKGHNESGNSSSPLASSLKKEGYEVGEVNLATDGVPEDASLIISLAPSNDFTAEECEALDKFLQGGGKAAFAFSAGMPKLDRLYAYLNDWGLTVNRDYVIESDSSKAIQTSNGTKVPAPELQDHKINEKLKESDALLVTPSACSIGINGTNPQYAEVTPLLKTSSNSWGITDLTAQTTERRSDYNIGPLTIAAVAEKQNSGKVFVIGSVQAVDMKELLENSSYINGDFMLNTFSYMTGKDDALNIRAKTVSAENLTMTEKQINVVSILVQDVMPAAIIIVGLYIWLKRRYL